MRGNCAADQRLCLWYKDSTGPLHHKSVKCQANFFGCTAWFVLDPKDRFSRDVAHINFNYKQYLKEGLSACTQCEGVRRLGWVKASRLLEYNHTNRIRF